MAKTADDQATQLRTALEALAVEEDISTAYADAYLEARARAETAEAALAQLQPRPSTAVDIAGRIRALEAELHALKRQLRNDDDAHLLRAIATRVGEYVFTAAELVTHATIDAALREALGRCTHPRTVGKRLSRLANRLHRDNQNIVLRCIGRDQDGCIWQIEQSG